MNCQSFETVVSDIAREQMIDASVRDEALAHGGECVDCGQRLEDERAISDRLSGLAAGFAVIEAPARIEARLLAAFDEQSIVKSQPLANSPSRYWIAAIAALLLVVLGISIARWQTGTTPSRNDLLATRDKAPDVAPPGSVPVSATGGENTQSDPPQPPRPAYRPKYRPASQVRPASTNSANREIVTDFLPVTYGGAANLADGGRMFRVELPRSAMATFGLPVNMDRANEKVKADVLVGVDGLAHAIRFVR